MEHKKYDIFVSYSRTDIDIVRKLVAGIHSKTNARCWVDWNGIESGDQFVEVIISAIDQVDVVLFVLSDSSMSSSYVKKEIVYARNTGKKVIPVVADGGKLRGWFLFQFGETDYIDLTSEQQYDKLIENVQEWFLGKNIPAVDAEVVQPEEVKDDALLDTGYNESKTDNGKLKDLFSFVKRYKVWLSITTVLAMIFVCLILLPDHSKNVARPVPQQAVLDYEMPYHAGHAYVDLGLPSGVKWSAYNIGLDGGSESNGKYYAWGEAYAKKSYSDRNSKTLGISMPSISNDSEHDVATQKWGAGWRIPTKEDFTELFNSENCSYSWRSVNGKNGLLIISKRNNNTLFLPAAGIYNSERCGNENRSGYYWTATPDVNDSQYANYVNIFDTGYKISNAFRYKGLSVRPVWGGDSLPVESITADMK